MNAIGIAGQSEPYRREVQQWWGELTDDELDQIAGSAPKLAGLLQARYGFTRKEAERAVQEFIDRWWEHARQ